MLRESGVLDWPPCGAKRRTRRPAETLLDSRRWHPPGCLHASRSLSLAAPLQVLMPSVRVKRHDGTFAGGPRRRRGRRNLQGRLHGCQQRGPNGSAIEGPCIPFARYAQRSRAMFGSSRQVDPTTRAGHGCSGNGNREDPTENGHRTLVPNRLRGRRARRQQPKQLPTIVAPYPP